MDGCDPSCQNRGDTLGGPQCFELSVGSPCSDSGGSEAPEATPLPISFDIDGVKKPQAAAAMTPGRKRLEGYGSTKVISPRIDLSSTPNRDAKAAKARNANAQKRERVERTKLEREAAAEAKIRNIENKCEAARVAKERHEKREAEKKAKRQETWRSAAISIHGEPSVRSGSASIHESVVNRSPGVSLRLGRSTDKGFGFVPPARTASNNIKVRPASPLASGGSRAELSRTLDMSIRSTCSHSPPPQRLTQPVAPNLHSSQRATKPRGSSHLKERPEAVKSPDRKSESTKSPTKTPKRQQTSDSDGVQQQLIMPQANEQVPSNEIKDESQQENKEEPLKFAAKMGVGKNEQGCLSPLSTTDDELAAMIKEQNRLATAGSENRELAVEAVENAVPTRMEGSIAIRGGRAFEIEAGIVCRHVYELVADATISNAGCDSFTLHDESKDIPAMEVTADSSTMGTAESLASVTSSQTKEVECLTSETPVDRSPNVGVAESCTVDLNEKNTQQASEDQEADKMAVDENAEEASSASTIEQETKLDKQSEDTESVKNDDWVSPRSSSASILSKDEPSMVSDSVEEFRDTTESTSSDAISPRKVNNMEAVEARKLSIEIAELRREHAAEKEKLELCRRTRCRLEEKLNRCREVVARTVASVDTLVAKRRDLQNTPAMEALEITKAGALLASAEANAALESLKREDDTSPSKENSLLINAKFKETVQTGSRSVLQDLNTCR